MIDPSERGIHIVRTYLWQRIYNGLANQRSPHNSSGAGLTITRKIADIKREDLSSMRRKLFACEKIGTRVYTSRINFDESLKIDYFLCKCLRILFTSFISDPFCKYIFCVRIFYILKEWKTFKIKGLIIFHFISSIFVVFAILL